MTLTIGGRAIARIGQQDIGDMPSPDSGLSWPQSLGRKIVIIVFSYSLSLSLSNSSTSRLVCVSHDTCISASPQWLLWLSPGLSIAEPCDASVAWDASVASIDTSLESLRMKPSILPDSEVAVSGDGFDSMASSSTNLDA